VIYAMRLFGRIEDKHGVDDPDYLPPQSAPDDFEPEDDTPEYVVNPVGAGLAVLGGALLALATFLPLDEPSGLLARVQSNTLIQHEGWWLLLAGAAIAAAGVSSYSGKRRTRGAILLSVIAGALVIYFATNKSLRTLYPVGASGEANESATGTVVPLGIAVYVAGSGVFLALLGGLIMRRPQQRAPASDATTKQCPDCAETILAQAHVCKHCGYRFDNEARP
jgi:ribosomal protein L32